MGLLGQNLGGEVAGIVLSGHLPGHLGRIQTAVFQPWSQGTIMGLLGHNLGGEVAGTVPSGRLPGHLGRIQAGVFQGYS